MKKQKQSINVLLFFLAMLLLCLPARSLLAQKGAQEEAKEEKNGANDKPPINIEIFVYDLTGGCVAQETSCKKEVLLAEKKEFYKQLINAAELNDLVTLQLFNARYPSQQARLKKYEIPDLDQYITKPYPLIIVNGKFEKNMVRSPRSFYEGLLPYLEETRQEELANYIEELESQVDNALLDNKMIFFTRDDCPWCDKIMPFLEDYMDDRFVILELYEGENQDLYREMLELYGYPAGPNQLSTLVPAIFVKDAYLRGTMQIKDYLPEMDFAEDFATILPLDFASRAVTRAIPG